MRLQGKGKDKGGDFQPKAIPCYGMNDLRQASGDAAEDRGNKVTVACYQSGKAKLSVCPCVYEQLAKPCQPSVVGSRRLRVRVGGSGIDFTVDRKFKGNALSPRTSLAASGQNAKATGMPALVASSGTRMP